jgi:hypothetical protein
VSAAMSCASVQRLNTSGSHLVRTLHIGYGTRPLVVPACCRLESSNGVGMESSSPMELQVYCIAPSFIGIDPTNPLAVVRGVGFMRSVVSARSIASQQT